MQTQGASSLWSSNSSLGGLESNWGLGTPYPSGANSSLVGFGSNNSLSNNQGHMQSSASSCLGESNSNPIGLGNRGGFGSPASIPASQQSTNKLPTSLSGNVQGSLSVGGAQPNGPKSSQQSGTFTTSQSQGSGSVSFSQGNGSFGNNVSFQKISSGCISSGLSSNPTNSNSAQSTDNLTWGLPSSPQDSRLTVTDSWGDSSGAEWNPFTSSSTSQSQSQQPPSNSNTPLPQSEQGDQQKPSSWAQAAGKGLNLSSNNQNTVSVMSPEELQQQALIQKAIESHDGWGKKPIRQDTQWSIETSPKVQRKITASVVPEQQKGTNNMWNNDNGTAIWEANKDMSAWSGSPTAPPPSRVPGQLPSNWPGVQQKPPELVGGQWSVANQGQAPGSEKVMGPWGGAPATQSGQGSSVGQWSGSTETGSWGGHFGGNTQVSNVSIASGGGIPGVGSVPGGGVAGGISTWGESDGTSNWGDAGGRNSSINETNSFWSDAQTKQANVPINWNAAGKMPAGQAVMGQNRKIGSNWGEPVGRPDSKIDDGTSHWTMGNQTVVRPPGWNPDQSSPGQWMPGIDKSITKLSNPEQFGGVDAINWNLPRDGVSVKLPGSGGGGSSNQPQMRSRLLQQLMDMGFKKDEAQHALITNNMNVQNAIADLYNRRGANGSQKDDADMSRLLSQKGAHDDISDTQNSNSFVPNINHMQNTPFNNAQSKIPNQFPFSNGPSLNPSSLSSNNPSINPALQQKIIQKFQSQNPPPPTPLAMNSLNPTQGVMGRAQLPAGQPSFQQQMAQQQILQQLGMAVQAGLISPQLLDKQLPAPVVLMLQQLLQHQQSLQQLITNQQMLQQPKLNMNPQMQRQQSEQVAARINTIKQQVLMLMKNISQAQSTLLKSQQQQSQQGSSENDSTLQNDLNNLSISPAQPQSRLTQWRRSTPDKDSSDSNPASSEDTSTSATVITSSSNDSELGDCSSLNKAVGSKSIQQSHSTPNLRRFDELGLTQLGGDTTWSTGISLSSQNWPNTNAPTTSGTISDTTDGKHSLSSGVNISGSSSSVFDSIPAIPEFVPGKPWQGITKSVEDDPHITPGSFSRSLSVNTIKDDYLLSLTKSSPSNEDNSSWPSKSLNSSTTQSINKPWGAGEVGHIPSSFTSTSDLWGLPLGKAAMSRPPPPPGLLYQQQNKQQNSYMNRQQSWAGNVARSDGGHLSGGNWLGSGISSALLLKNLTPQIDGSTLRTLCMQHGPLQYFYLNLPHGQALVKYKSIDEAVKAQRALNTCLLGNTTLVAEFVSEDEATRFAEKQNAIPSASQWSQMGHQSRPAVNVGGGNHRSQNLGNWGIQTPTSSTMSATGMWGGAGNIGGNMGGNTGGLWDIEDNSAHNLLGNMLGDAM